MLKTYVVTKRYYYLAVGTILKENIVGDFFVSMPDEDFLKSCIDGRPVLAGGIVEIEKEHFLDVTDIDLAYIKVIGPDALVIIDDGVKPFNRPMLMPDEIKAAKAFPNSYAHPYRPVIDPLPPVHKIPAPHPSKWPGALVVSKYVVSNYYGSIPAGTIFQLQNHLTVNKAMRSIPCSACKVSLDYTFKGSREAFLHNFYFVDRDKDEPLTQALLLGDEHAATQ